MISEFEKEKVFWTKRMNIKLVKFIESRPNIWNPKHPKYTSMDHRDQTYSEFAAKYGNEFTGQAVKERWTNIRSTFANYLRKLSASRAKSDGEEYKVSWHLWEPCQFLLKVNKKMKADNSTAEANGDDQEATNHSVETDPNEDWISESENKHNIENSFETESKETNCKNIAENLVQIFKDIQKDTFGLENTENGLLGRVVARKLSQMSSYNAAKASQKIMEVLLLYNENNPLNPNSLKNNDF